MTLTPRSPSRQVACFIESSRAIGRAILQGVARYRQECGSWTTYFSPCGLEIPLSRWLSHWHGDGILARVTTPRQAESIRATRLPAIDLRGVLKEPLFLQVLADNTAIAQLAFEHFHERGLRRFAYCGLPAGLHHHQDERRKEFHRLVEKAGLSCAEFSFRLDMPNIERIQDELAVWLSGLPKPIGILACYDDYAYQILEACRLGGVRIPEDVAVLGVDNDPLLCTLSQPTLSSIDPNGPQMGYEAAAWLDRLMDSRKAPGRRILIKPRSVVVRRSTSQFTLDDPEVAAAVHFIHEHACEGIRVSDILRVVPLSQHVLEERFRRCLGRTPKAELLRVQIEQAQQLLRETDLPLKSIARRTGFSSEKYFSDVFLRSCGRRPTAYRKLHMSSSPIW